MKARLVGSGWVLRWVVSQEFKNVMLEECGAIFLKSDSISHSKC